MYFIPSFYTQKITFFVYRSQRCLDTPIYNWTVQGHREFQGKEGHCLLSAKRSASPSVLDQINMLMLMLIGTPVPDGLTLINDTKDYYLLGPAVEMAVDGKFSV
jgi:hypothetical protein